MDADDPIGVAELNLRRGSTCRCGCRSDDRSVASQEEGPSPEWHVPIEVGFSLLCAYGCLSYSALIFGHPAMLAP